MPDTQSYNELPPWVAQALGIGGGLGQAGAGAYGLYHPQPNPADAANKRLGQIPGQVDQYYSPYINAGRGAMDTLTNQNKDLLSGGKQSQLGESYKESPGYQARLRAAMTAGSNAAASGGMLGTPMNQEDMMNRATYVASQDYNDYLQNQINLYNTGYGGTQDINHQGYDASKGMADATASTTGQQAAYDYSGQAGKNAAHAQNMSNIWTGVGTAAGAALGSAGGPAGTAAGGAAGAAFARWLNDVFSGQGKGV